MEEFQHHHHHHHHHHHGHDTNHGSEGHQYVISSQDAVNANSVIGTNHRQQQQQSVTQSTLSVPTRASNVSMNQTSDGIQATGSFHSVSSIDSAAEMSRYFPDAQTPNLSPFRHQQGVGGQSQSTAVSNTIVTTTTANTVNAGPYIHVARSTPAQRFPQPVRTPFMAQQQQQQRPVRPPGQPQLSSGIPSYSSQIEGLSVSQTVVNDVLVDLQSKMINETLQQYQDGSSDSNVFEPLPPIYLRAPQPTIILQSDFQRLRAELNSRVRPPVVYRHPAGVNQFQQNQFQQHRFQHNTFQTPRFPAPPQQRLPPECYGEYRNAAYANSDEYKTTIRDEHRKENEERLYNEAESPMLNDVNINANVHSTFDLQGLSTTPFDRYASPYQSSLFLSNLEDQQQDNEKTPFAASHQNNDEEIGSTSNMSVHSRQEITFDIDNCIARCFEAHRQRLARRRAARQARRARRHRTSGSQQDQQLYHSDRYQTFPTQPAFASFDTTQRTQWHKRSSLTSHYSDIAHDAINAPTAHTSRKPYIPPGAYDYTNLAQSTSLPTDDNQRYQSMDSVNSQTDQIPFAALLNNVQSLTADYHKFKPINTQEPYIDSNTLKYASYQTAPSTMDLIQQPSHEQRQEQTSFEFSSQLPYSSFPSMDATVPVDAQHLPSEYYQQHQQQIPPQFIQHQEPHGRSSSTFDYTEDSTLTQIPTYDYQNTEQQSFQYPYNGENIQQQQSLLNYDTTVSSTYVSTDTDTKQSEQKQTFDYGNQALNSSDYYQHQQPIAVPRSQAQETYGHPTGTFEYSKESYQSQEPIYDYQNTNQQPSQYLFNAGDIQQTPQQDSYNYPTASTSTYLPSQIDSNSKEQRQTFDYSNQAFSSSDYYQQQSIPVPTSQVQEGYTQPSGTFGYGTRSTQSQIPPYDFQNREQQSFQYPYNIENIQQTEQKQTFDYSSQPLGPSDYYQQQPVSGPISQKAYTQPSGTFEYDTGSTESQAITYDYHNIEQQPFQYPYNDENIEQQQSFDYTSAATAAYIPSKNDIQQADQKQTFDYSNQTLDSSDYYQQQLTSVPIAQAQGTYDQSTGRFEYLKDSYQSQGPIYDYPGADQQSPQYSYNFDDIQQQKTQQQEEFNYTTDAGTAYSPSENDIQQPEQRQTADYTSQTYSSADHYQQKPVSIPISQVYDSQLLGQRLSGGSLPTGTVEYTRQAYYSQEPSPDDIYIKQHQQQEESESFSINDYLKRFESGSYAQINRGQTKFPDDPHSVTTTTSTTTPLTIQPNVDIYQSHSAAQTYDLQNYSNECLESEASQPPLPSSLSFEEDQQNLLQHTSTSEQTLEPNQQLEQRSEVETSMYDTYSSLPPPPTAKEIDRLHQANTANIPDFPAPPTPDRHSYQTAQQRINRSFTSIIPSTDEPSVYTGHPSLQPTSPSSNDQRTEDEIKEDEEIFDLRQCIATCYAKYRESWNKEEQRQYEQQIRDTQQPISDRNIIDNQQIGQYQQTISKQPRRKSIPSGNQQSIQQSNAFVSFHGGQQEQQPRSYIASGEIHYIDGWTQTPSLDVITQSNVVQHTYDQTPSSFDTKPYIPQLSTRGFSTDSRGQQTIEYSPPLITQPHHVVSTIPSSGLMSSYEYTKHEQKQQQQQVYDHALPVPPHLSFNDNDYQSNLYFSSQLIDQSRQYENIPYDKYIDDEQQQQRYRAHSEPASIQQDSLASNAPLLSISSQILDQHPRRSISIPMINHHEAQSSTPSVRMLDNGRAYETDAVYQRHIPRIDPKTGLCLVPCPEQTKYAHLPPHLRPELFCVELPPAGSLPPVPPPPPPAPPGQRWCVKCCCVPGRTLIKKVVYKQVEEEKQQQQQQQEESQMDYASVIDQMATKITVRYGNSTMEEGEAFVQGNYSEKLRVIDFPVYVSGKNDPNLTPLVPVN